MTIPLTRAAEGLDRRAFTIADVERMVEVGIIDPDERLEILGGEIVPMSPKGSRHEAIKIAITARWGRMRPDGFMFAQEPGLRLDSKTYVEPDFIVYEDTKPFAEIRGSDVLLAVEVADSSLAYDLMRKPLVYAAFGVPEYWVIDAARRIVHLRADPSSGRYAREDQKGASERVVPAFAPAAFGFALDDLDDVVTTYAAFALGCTSAE